MKYIQSFYNYPVYFSSIKKGVPAKDATGPMRNVAEFTEAEFKTLQEKEAMFRSLVSQRKYRVLDYLPESAKPDATRINEAKKAAKAAETKAEDLAKENAELKAKLAELEKAGETKATYKKAAAKK